MRVIFPYIKFGHHGVFTPWVYTGDIRQIKTFLDGGFVK
jgi:hypothetical protein